MMVVRKSLQSADNRDHHFDQSMLNLSRVLHIYFIHLLNTALTKSNRIKK